MNTNEELIKLWSELTYELGNVLINKYRTKQYKTFKPQAINEIKKNLIYDESFFLFYQFIDRWLFQRFGPIIRGYILNDTFEKSALKHMLKTYRKNDLDDFIDKACSRQEFWGSFKEFVTEAGVGGVVYDYSQNIAEIATSDRYDFSYMNVYADAVLYYSRLKQKLNNIPFDSLEDQIS